jgi:hypothetical protein
MPKLISICPRFEKNSIREKNSPEWELKNITLRAPQLNPGSSMYVQRVPQMKFDLCTYRVTR